jgi:hypothetical protein
MQRAENKVYASRQEKRNKSQSDKCELLKYGLAMDKDEKVLVTLILGVIFTVATR